MHCLNTNFSLLYEKLRMIILKSSKTIEKDNSCKKCVSKNSKKEKYYSYTYENITFTDCDIHNLIKHNKIQNNLFTELCKINIKNYPITFNLVDTNGLNIADGLFEQGSNKIYTDRKKNVFDIQEFKYSEHYGYFTFENNTLNKVIVINKHRIEPNDPSIYLPKNTKELKNATYIFHTHPKTPNIISRANEGTIYDMPSVHDILHFIEHFNYENLLCSVVISNEGLYNIRKYNFNNNKIKLDVEVFVDNFDDTLMECSDYAFSEYIDIILNNDINEVYFHEVIANDFTYINLMNKMLMKYDLYIDYFPRIKIEGDYWVIPDVFLPFITKN